MRTGIFNDTWLISHHTTPVTAAANSSAINEPQVPSRSASHTTTAEDLREATLDVRLYLDGQIEAALQQQDPNLPPLHRTELRSP